MSLQNDETDDQQQYANNTDDSADRFVLELTGASTCRLSADKKDFTDAGYDSDHHELAHDRLNILGLQIGDERTQQLQEDYCKQEAAQEFEAR